MSHVLGEKPEYELFNEQQKKAVDEFFQSVNGLSFYEVERVLIYLREQGIKCAAYVNYKKIAGATSSSDDK